MAEDGKYITNSGGDLKEERAVRVGAGAGDVDKLARLNEDGQWDETLLPNAEVKIKTAFEALGAGDLIHIKSDGEMELADGSAAGKEVHGFVKTAISAAATGKFYSEGMVPGATLTVGATYFLSTTAGEFTVTAPSGSGNVVQKVGVAESATELQFEAQQTIELL